MKNFDWFTALMMLAIAENTICFIIQGGWLAVFGLMFGGFWVWLAINDWRRHQIIKADAVSRAETTDIQRMSEVFRRVARIGISSSEFSDALNNACSEPQFIGDVSCKWNAGSPYIRCAINPSGECQGCKDYERI
ncbi:MAG TPA: DUF6464 family protein [Nostoc sp.]|uniref:DUF6464 family protein n=1 Tax=Nostoc sp. TaxID=1180 RepID=UPI002D2D124A|nr:DUF6464 family protein [Nostoc sp.]HYX17062.1 DUF6464 family protein [Nostoc sp.]